MSKKVHRTAVFHRTPLTQSQVTCTSCKLCKNTIDCQGVDYECSGKYKVIYIDESFTDWEELESLIWDCEDNGLLLRLITDQKIPQKVLWALSYNAKNILQMNLDMLHFSHNVGWIRKLAAWSNNCGLFYVVFIYPVVPTVVKSYQVVMLMDMLRNVGYHHFDIKFAQLSKCKSVGGFINFNGKLVPTKYLKKTNTGWDCKQEFIEAFMSKVNVYVIPKKISVSMCGISSDCTGLGGIE